jgi:adenosylhomocysteine nucleosidase
MGPGSDRMTEAGRFPPGRGRGRSVSAPGLPILAVTGLAREAAALGADVVPLISGADPDWLRRALAEKAKTPFSAVVSFGLAGGLDPSLAAGTMIVASGVVAGRERLECSPDLARMLVEGFSGAGVTARQGLVAGVEVPVMTAEGKARLYRESGALAVDMESHLAASFARQRGLSFAVARVVSDPAGRALPPLAARAVRPDGSVDLGLVLGALAREPRQLGGLLAAGLDSGRAFATLRCCGPLLGSLLRLALS